MDCKQVGAESRIAEPHTAEPSTAEPHTAESHIAESHTAEPHTAESDTIEPSSQTDKLYLMHVVCSAVQDRLTKQQVIVSIHT